jgi:hypothetical protein
VVRTAAEWNRAESLIVAFLETEREADGWRFTSDEAAQDWRNRLLLAPAIFEGRRVGTWVGSSASGTLFASVHGWRWLLHCLHEVLPLIAGDPYEKISGYFSELLTIDEEIDFSFCGNALLCAPKELFWLLEAVISSGLVPVTYAPPTVEEAERLVGQIKDALRTLADVAFRASSLLSQVNLNGLQDCDGHSARQIFFQAGLADSQLAAAFLLSEGLLKLSRGSAWDYVAMFFDEDSRFSLKAFKAHGRPLSVPE